MKHVYCSHGHHRVPSALINDLKVRQPMCLDCRARILAAPRVKAEPKRPALPARRFLVIAR